MSDDREALMAAEDVDMVAAAIWDDGHPDMPWAQFRGGLEPIREQYRSRARAAIAAWNQRTRPAADGVREQIDSIIREEMLDGWCDICSDTGFHPLDIEQLGRRRLEYKDRHWTDRVAGRSAVRILALLPKPVEGEIDDGPIRIAIWNVLRNDGVSDERCYRLINAVCKALPTPTSDGVRDDG